jgi:dihydrofolate reductase
MRPLRYSINVTLDGCVDHRAGIPDPQSHLHAAETIARADAVLFGRVTYQLMADAWRPPVSPEMPDWTQPFAQAIDTAKKYVVSATLTSPGWNTELITGDVRAAVEELKSVPGEGLYVGGVTLPTALAEWGLIDEYTFIVQPRVAGHGPRLFEGLPAPLDLSLVDRTEFDSGMVVLTYVPAGR